MNNAKLYLCKADCSILGVIDGIKSETGSLKRNATDLWELTFEVDRFVESKGKLVQSDYYDSIDDMMRLYLDSEEIQAFFVIDSEPVISGDGLQETKTVTAHSIETELSYMYLKDFKVNNFTEDSQDYLAKVYKVDENGDYVYDDEGNIETEENIDTYTSLPKSYISLVNYKQPNLSLMHLVLENTGWSIVDNISEDLQKEIRYYLVSDNNSVYSFLMKTLSPAFSVIFTFDRKNKKIGIERAENFGKDTGIFVTMRNLMNSFEVTSSSEDNIITKLIPTGANNIDIRLANFAQEYIINLDYFMNTLNEYGDYKFVSKELHDKYDTWKSFRDKELVTYTFDYREKDKDFTGTRREFYKELTKEYNSFASKISEVRNRVPNDGCLVDYKTYSLEDLKLCLTAYENAANALITVYKNEYGVTEIGDAPDYTPTPSNATNIKNTPYWYDYYAYKEKIIPQVIETFKMYCETNEYGDLKVDEYGNYIEKDFGNVNYYQDESILKDITAYLYEWSLYGLDELESKRKAWAECANILFKDCFRASDYTEDNPTYITADDAGWNNLGDNQSLFTSKDAFVNQLNQFLDYMSPIERQNSLTGTVCKGVIVQCQKAIKERNDEIKTLEEKRDVYGELRDNLALYVMLENFKVNESDTNPLFTSSDIKIIQSMLRTKDYNNEYILTTNLDDSSTMVDRQEELYQDALLELDKISQPQYSFATELDNLYSLEEFKEYREPFDVGNFIRVGLEIHEDLYENNYIKLRLMSITHNPFVISEELSVEFSTMTKTLNTVSDLAFLIDSELGGSTSSSSSSSSSSDGGTYGNNDANVQMSNTMLNALLTTELFGTAVNDVLLDTMKANKGNFKSLFAHSGVFDSLEAGQIKVSGDCLFDRIKSSNWNGTENNLLGNTEGSILDLSNGKFNFAGGKLKWDGTTLSVDGNGTFTGDIVANSLTLGTNVKVPTSNLSDANSLVLKDIDIGKQNSTHTSSFFNVSSDGLLTAENAVIYGTVYATDGEFSGTLKGCDGSFTGSINVNDKFIVDNNGNVTADGTLVASDADIEGDINATTLTANGSGFIAGWNFNSTAFYKGSDVLGTNGGKYLGDDGFSISDYFVVNDDGVYIVDQDYEMEHYEYTLGSSDNPLGINVDDGGYIKLYLNNISDTAKTAITFYLNLTYDTETTTGNIASRYKTWHGSWQTSSDSSEIWKDQLNNYCILRINYTSFTNMTITDATSQYNPIIKYVTSTTNNPADSSDTQTYELAEIALLEIYNSSNELVATYDGTCTSRKKGMSYNSFQNYITNNNWYLGNDEIGVYNGLSISCYSSVDFNYSGVSLDENGLSINYIYKTTSNDKEITNLIERVKINKNELIHKGLSTVSSGSTLRITDDGSICKYSSSSERYKDNMTTNISEELHPYKLYNLNIYDFIYKDWYLSPIDQRYGKHVIGFKAEDVYKKYPIACNLNSEGLPEVPEYNILIAPMLWLIQDQHKDIENLKEQITELKQLTSNSEVS